MTTAQDVIDEIIDRAHYVTGNGGPHEVRYISINEHALRAAIATVLYTEAPRDPTLRLLSIASLAQAVGTAIDEPDGNGCGPGRSADHATQLAPIAPHPRPPSTPQPAGYEPRVRSTGGTFDQRPTGAMWLGAP
jgi:hypothetical protein